MTEQVQPGCGDLSWKDGYQVLMLLFRVTYVQLNRRAWPHVKNLYFGSWALLPYTRLRLLAYTRPEHLKCRPRPLNG